MSLSNIISKNGKALALVYAVATASCGASHSATTGEPVRRRGQVAEFSLRDTDGRLVRLSDYVGKNVVLLNFWATWCGPCAGEMPILQRLYSRYEDRGFVVLGVAMDGPETIASVAPVARGYGVTFPILLDEETRVVGVYNPKRTAPLSILIGRTGTVASVREGFTPGDALDIEREINGLLAVGP